MGNGTIFSIIAFSLGAPISLAFAAAYPSSMRSLVLLGPAGLLRQLPEGYGDKFMHQPELAPSPEVIRGRVREILGVAPSGPALDIQLGTKRVTPVTTGHSRVRRSFDIGAILQWQFDHHQGHIHSFQDTIRYGPLQAEDLWRNVCDMIAGRVQPKTAMLNSKLLVFFGEDDNVVVGKETTEDILRLLPASNVQTEYLPGGHGFPYPNSEKITQTIVSSWGLGTAVK